MEEIVVGKLKFTKWYLYQTSITKDEWRRDCRIDAEEAVKYPDNHVILIREKDMKPGASLESIARAPFFYRVNFHGSEARKFAPYFDKFEIREDFSDVESAKNCVDNALLRLNKLMIFT
jgi:hypothetical protein